MEIVVSEKYASKVLTDEASFSFEAGVADVGEVAWAFSGPAADSYLVS